jgi:hypothetical protein
MSIAVFPSLLFEVFVGHPSPRPQNIPEWDAPIGLAVDDSADSSE